MYTCTCTCSLTQRWRKCLRWRKRLRQLLQAVTWRTFQRPQHIWLLHYSAPWYPSSLSPHESLPFHQEGCVCVCVSVCVWWVSVMQKSKVVRTYIVEDDKQVSSCFIWPSSASPLLSYNKTRRAIILPTSLSLSLSLSLTHSLTHSFWYLPDFHLAKEQVQSCVASFPQHSLETLHCTYHEYGLKPCPL